MMAGLFSSRGRELGIDIGTDNTNIYVEGRGIVVSEPSVVATDPKQEGIVAVGADAERLLRLTPDMLNELTPLRDGFIVDYRVTRTMLQYFMQKASGKTAIGRTKVLLAVPCGITDVEKRAMTDAIVQAGAREAYLIESPVAVALAAGLPIFEARGTMTIDIGEGTTDIGVMSLGGMVLGKTARVGGGDFNEAIAQYIRQCFSIMVGEQAVEHMKCKLGTVLEPAEDEEFIFQGRDMANGLTKRMVIHKSELYQIMQGPFLRLLEVIRSVLEQLPPEIAADILERGLVMSGGAAVMNGLGERLARELEIPVHILEEPTYAVARGLGRAFKEFSRMDRFIIAVKNRKGRA